MFFRSKVPCPTTLVAEAAEGKDDAVANRLANSPNAWEPSQLQNHVAARSQ